jgi:putative hydrolase of the HAD superfamily
MSIATVVFDFGNVLGFFSHRQAAEQLAAYAPRASPDDIQAFLFGGDLEDAYESGLVSSADLLQMLRDEFALSGSDDELARAFGDMFVPNPDVCALVPLLRPRYRLVLLSNTNDMHYRCFRPQFADVLDHFHGLIVSYQVGVRKPNAGIYEHARALAGCPAEQCLFIDDMPSNVAAARACGWQGIVYRRGDDLRRLLLSVGVAIAA